MSPVSVETLNGARLAFQQFGPIGAPTIVLVAGGASSMDWWDDEFCALLAAGDARSGPRRVVRFDFRDTGQSETVPPGTAEYTGGDLVDDIAALIEHLHATPAHVVGLSMGGALVQRLALARPELLASVTLMATTAIGGVDGPLPPPTAALAASFDDGTPETDWGDPEAIVAATIDAEHLYSGTIPVDENRVRRITAATLARTESPASADTTGRFRTDPSAPPTCAKSPCRRWSCTDPTIRCFRCRTARSWPSSCRARDSSLCPAWVTSFRHRRPGTRSSASYCGIPPSPCSAVRRRFR